MTSEKVEPMVGEFEPMPAILPCPYHPEDHADGPPVINEIGKHYRNVLCECGASSQPMPTHRTAIAAWNRVASLRARLDAMEKLAREAKPWVEAASYPISQVDAWLAHYDALIRPRADQVSSDASDLER